MRAPKKRFLIPGVALGLLILVAAIALKPSPVLQPSSNNGRLVEVISLLEQTAAPQIKGFGRIEPKQTWQAIAEVNGKIVYRHPDLETGQLIKKGTLVLEVEPLQYQLKLAQAQANLTAAKAQLSRLTQEQQNLHTSLAIEEQKLALAKQEYQRKLALKNKKLISNSDLENEQQALLAQRILVQNLHSALSLLPDDKNITAAQISVNQALLEDASRQLANTRFTLPFDALIGEVNIAQAQAVTTGASLFAAQALGALEIKAQLSLQDAQILMQSITALPDNGPFSSIEQHNLHTQISLQLGNKIYYWPAKLTRIAEAIDPNQATIGFYLQVEQPFDTLELQKKPLLSKGMFVSAEIQGGTSAQFIIPEKALHGNTIYLMDAQQKLQIKTVTVRFRNEQGVAISGDLSNGEQLVLNDLIPAIAGMRLKFASSDAAAQETNQ